MKRTIVSIILGVCLLGAAGWSVIAQTEIQEQQGVILGLEQDKTGLEEDIGQLESDKAKLESGNNQLGVRLEQAEATIRITKTERNDFRDERDALQREYDRLKRQWQDRNVELAQLEQHIASLYEQLYPANPTHNLSVSEVRSNPAYWNMAWGKDYHALQQTVLDANNAYFSIHTYIEGETDCNDMACDIWNILHARGVTSIIVIGNLNLGNELFVDCDHAWLLIVDSQGYGFALEPTNGQLYFGGDAEIDQYLEGFCYARPSDLRADLGRRW